MDKKILMNEQLMSITLQRLCRQLIENHNDFSKSVIIGLQPRGIAMARRIQQLLEESGVKKLRFGSLDITFFRDDFRMHAKPLKANETRIDFVVEQQRVIFVDDVLYTGRSVRAAMDAIQSFGRPSQIELMVLIDRRFSRQLPIQATYIGRPVDAIASERVIVEWKEENEKDQVIIIRHEG
ncbi:bifunctional pyr operon transcriptional regulator/uracil phosphoribosyltransferase PyrR [Schleiferia thermophila]|jgi:pyrimidine operon attenuation protein/uracil phosphoribosyltransferase|uniref:bifunctional pyr operon transcriptional regulator/uracil phosphoribosyltransferase PyrR n=1 Tax=Schleiferia thermophila TaxID=884107 RepID=UPI0004E65004|nr:bifunctional pyr operon transcriptional regulator/uracil phosphoribosyltransferase PyrR [Schleiferia thermophila]KFD38588.1 uracil phosphoribosyltransferase [Schleiferia thermophila str. Yellowstone]